MRKLIGLALTAATIAGAGLATSAQAQYYRPAPAPYAQPYGGYDNRYDPRYDNRYQSQGGYNNYNNYNSYGGSGGAGLAGALLGSLLGDNGGGGGYDRMPYDRYGADPNGMIARDGHRIKCKLQDRSDGYGRSVRQRVCW